MKKILATLLLTSVFSLTANAGIHVEPYMGYEAGKIELSVPNTPISDALTGVTLGARIGYSIPFFWAAADFSTASSLTSEVSKTAGGDGGGSSTRTGITAGFTLIPMLDFMAGYILSANTKFSVAGGNADLKGSGYKLGLGFTMLPFVSLIVEYFDIKYDNTTSPIALNNITEKGVMLSVSLPLDL